MHSNTKLTSKLNTVIALAVALFLLCLSTWIMAVSFLHPQDNLITKTLIILTVFFMIAEVGLFFVWDRFIATRYIKLNNILFTVGLSVYSVFLYVFNAIFRSFPGLFDYGILMSGASSVASKTPFEVVWYIEREKQQFKPILYLGTVKKCANLLGFDEYYLYNIISISAIVLSVLSIRYLAGSDKNERIRFQCPILALFMAYIPFVYYVPFLYTDTLSLGMGIISITLLKLSFDSVPKHKFITYLISALSGLVLGYGYTGKVTCFIPVIAFIIIYCTKIRKKHLPQLGIAVLFAVIFIESTTLWANQYPIYANSKDKGDPAIHYVALGIHGDGSLAFNNDYEQAVLSLNSSKEVSKFAWEHIKSHKSDLVSYNHYRDKTALIFANGTANVKQAVANDDNANHIKQQLFGYNGKYYWRMCQISFCYMFSLWGLILCCCILTIVKILKNHEENAILSCVQLAIIGAIIFVLIWESNSRQLFNQMPGIFLCAFFGMRMINDVLSERIHKRDVIKRNTK